MPSCESTIDSTFSSSALAPRSGRRPASTPWQRSYSRTWLGGSRFRRSKSPPSCPPIGGLQLRGATEWMNPEHLFSSGVGTDPCGGRGVTRAPTATSLPLSSRHLEESRPKGLHLRPLAERCVSLSTHTAPIRQTRRQYFDASVRTVCAACWQWTQSFGQPVFSAHYSAYTSALPTLSA